MKQSFKLKVGEILFDEDKIIIKDDAKKQKWYGSLITGMGTMILILFLLKSYKRNGVMKDSPLILIRLKQLLEPFQL